MTKDYIYKLRKHWINIFLVSIICPILAYIKSFSIEDFATSTFFINKALKREIRLLSRAEEAQFYASDFPRLFNVVSDYRTMLFIHNILFYVLLALGVFLIGVFYTRSNFGRSFYEPEKGGSIQDFEIQKIDTENVYIKCNESNPDFRPFRSDFNKISWGLSIVAFFLITVKDILYLSGSSTLYYYEYPVSNIFIEAPFMAFIIFTAGYSGSCMIKSKLVCRPYELYTPLPTWIEDYIIVPLGGSQTFASRYGASFEINYSFDKKYLTEMAKHSDKSKKK